MHRRKKIKTLDENILVVSWVEILAHMTRLLIHLHSLTFGGSTAEFRGSVERCVLSFAAVTKMLDNDALDQRISTLIPCGTSIIFQYGLTQVFNQCRLNAAAVFATLDWHITGSSHQQSSAL